jgi:hypothetical protein
VPVTNAAIPASPITISVPANTAMGTYTGYITVANSLGCISSVKPFTLTVGSNPTTISAANVSATYGDNSVTLTATVLPTGSAGNVEFFIDNNSVGTSALSSGTATFSYPLTGVIANSYSIKANYLGSATHGASSSDPGNNGVLTVNKASATIILTNLGRTYDGLTKSAGYTITPSTVTGVTISNNDKTDAGTYPVTASLINANYTAAPVSGNLLIAQAATNTTVTAANATYSGSPIEATATVTGNGGLSQGLTVTYSGTGSTSYLPSTTAPSDAGTYNATATYAATANYLGSTDTKGFSIAKALASVSPVASSKTYGTADPVFGGSLSGFVAADGVTALYTRATGETVQGSPYTISATLSPAGVLANYDITYNTANFTIGKATSVTTVTINGAPFTYTGAAQTPATVSVTGPGGLNLTPTANYANNIAAGLNTATASYTFAGDANYEPSSDSKTFTIGKAATITTVTIPAGPFAYTAAAQTPAAVTVTGPGLSLTPAADYTNNINA